MAGVRLTGSSKSWSGSDDSRCRLLVGMQRLPHEELRSALSLLDSNQQCRQRAKPGGFEREAAAEFREQLIAGAPSNSDEIGLQRLRAQIQAGKLVVKLFLRYPLHAKLYLLHRDRSQQPHNRLPGQQQPHARRSHGSRAS